MFSSVSADRRHCLLAFPLPGASAGPRDFLLYISTPADKGDFSVDREDARGVRGFLIQEVGELKGKTTIVSGQIRARSVWLKPHLHRLDLRLSCEDGTTIRGRAIVRDNREELRNFKHRHAADILLLEPAAQSTETLAPETTPRKP